MPEHTYEVTLEAPLGKRPGSLTLDSLDGECRGVLSLMSFANPVSGRIQEGGVCALSGWMRTLMRSLPFTAEGWVRRDAVELTLHWNGRSYPLHGRKKGV